MHKITLSQPEFLVGIAVGVMRHLSNILHGRVGRNGFEGGKWTEHIQGALGEMALAKHFGIYWSCSVDTFKAPDLPGRIQVRCRSRHDWDLNVRKNDNDNDRFVLVTGEGPVFHVHGWLVGANAKQDQWWDDKGKKGAPAFFVPQGELQPLDTLRSVMSS